MKLKQVLNRPQSVSWARNDSLNNDSLDTSSMNTAETDSTGPTGHESSFGDFSEACPFLGHRLYAPLKQNYKSTLGLLYLAKRRDTGKKVCIKLIERGPSVTRHVASELFLHRACAGNPLFVQLVDVFLAPQHLAIVMEHVPRTGPAIDILEMVSLYPQQHGGSGGLCEDQARWLFQQLVVGMMYLHSKGYNNRELKLSNKLLLWPQEGGKEDEEDEGEVNGVHPMDGAATPPTPQTHDKYEGIPMERSPSPSPSPSPAPPPATTTSPTPMLVISDSARPQVKVQDFMYSKSEQINSDPQSALAFLPYTAPEVLGNSLKQGSAADVWSLGVALFKMVTGMYPFDRPEDASDARSAVQAVLSRIASVEYVIPGDLSPDLRDLLGHMLVRNPEERMRCEDILNHPWVKKNMPPHLLGCTGGGSISGSSSSGCDDATTMPNGTTTAAPVMTEEALRVVLSEAQQSLRPLDSENIDDLADEILNEEEADDLLDELALG